MTGQDFVKSVQRVCVMLICFTSLHLVGPDARFEAIAMLGKPSLPRHTPGAC